MKSTLLLLPNTLIAHTLTLSRFFSRWKSPALSTSTSKDASSCFLSPKKERKSRLQSIRLGLRCKLFYRRPLFCKSTARSHNPVLRRSRISLSGEPVSARISGFKSQSRRFHSSSRIMFSTKDYFFPIVRTSFGYEPSRYTVVPLHPRAYACM